MFRSCITFGSVHLLRPTNASLTADGGGKCDSPGNRKSAGVSEAFPGRFPLRRLHVAMASCHLTPSQTIAYLQGLTIIFNSHVPWIPNSSALV